MHTCLFSIASLTILNELLASARKNITSRAEQWFQLVILNELNDSSLNDHELNEPSLNDPSSSLVHPYLEPSRRTRSRHNCRKNLQRKKDYKWEPGGHESCNLRRLHSAGSEPAPSPSSTLAGVGSSTASYRHVNSWAYSQGTERGRKSYPPSFHMLSPMTNSGWYWSNAWQTQHSGLWFVNA